MTEDYRNSSVSASGSGRDQCLVDDIEVASEKKKYRRMKKKHEAFGSTRFGDSIWWEHGTRDGRSSADTVTVEADMLRRMAWRVFILCKVGTFSQPGSFWRGRVLKD